jgi:hypothetical protein
MNITISAMGAAMVMRDCVYREEGLPGKVYSDRGPQFISRFMKEFYWLVRIEGNPSTAYHLQTNGQSERVNRKIEKYLRMFVGHNQDDWVDWLPLAEFMYNNSVNKVTRQTPFYLNKGHHPRALHTDCLADPEMLAKTYLQQIQDTAEKAKVSLTKAKAVMKKRWDSKKDESVEHTIGDLVLVSAERLPSN